MWPFTRRKRTDEFRLNATDGTEIVGRLTRHGALLLQVTDPAGRTVDVQVPAHLVPPLAHWMGNIEGAYSNVDPTKLQTNAPVIPLSGTKAGTIRIIKRPGTELE